MIDDRPSVNARWPHLCNALGRLIDLLEDSLPGELELHLGRKCYPRSSKADILYYLHSSPPPSKRSSLWQSLHNILAGRGFLPNTSTAAQLQDIRTKRPFSIYVFINALTSLNKGLMDLVVKVANKFDRLVELGLPQHHFGIQFVSIGRIARENRYFDRFFARFVLFKQWRSLIDVR